MCLILNYNQKVNQNNFQNNLQKHLQDQLYKEQQSQKNRVIEDISQSLPPRPLNGQTANRPRNHLNISISEERDNDDDDDDENNNRKILTFKKKFTNHSDSAHGFVSPIGLYFKIILFCFFHCSCLVFWRSFKI